MLRYVFISGRAANGAGLRGKGLHAGATGPGGLATADVAPANIVDAFGKLLEEGQRKTSHDWRKARAASATESGGGIYSQTTAGATAARAAKPRGEGGEGVGHRGGHAGGRVRNGGGASSLGGMPFVDVEVRSSVTGWSAFVRAHCDYGHCDGIAAVAPHAYRGTAIGIGIGIGVEID